MDQVYIKQESCCGCGICSIVCPKQAITMVPDIHGHIYPQIDAALCVDCGLCQQHCAFLNAEHHMPMYSYAGCNLDAAQKKLSTSAAIFPAIATTYLERGGLVYGATMDIENGQAQVRHILIDSLKDLPKLQGSKYVQSDFSTHCEDVLEALKTGKEILISGTPCQISGAKALFKKYDNQICYIDIICHGVPSLQFFNDYLQDYQKRYHLHIQDFLFRDKRFGWGLNGTIRSLDHNHRDKTATLTPLNSTYYHLFLNAEIYRSSCYACPYACTERVGDITLGDYWGVAAYDPQVLQQNGGAIHQNEGVSCILVNTETGAKVLNDNQAKLYCTPIALDHIRAGNSQLQSPAKYTQLRKYVMDAYSNQGYSAVHNHINRLLRAERTRLTLMKVIPKPVKTLAKRLLKK